jgi:hypothetical protein
MTSTEIEISGKVFGDEALAGMVSFDDAIAAFKSAGVSLENASDYGTGFALCENKNVLVGVDFLIIQWRFNEGDFGDDSEYVAAEIITKHKEKLVLIDGSTGIYRQLKLVTGQRIARGNDHPNAGLLVEGGLRRSDYDKEVDGKQISATTYYLSM